MKRSLLLCALGVLLGCRQAAAPSGEAITLSYATCSESKTDALTVGDEVAVYARVEGTEHYFLEAQKFITGSDGRTLSTTPTTYYPEVKQAINFYAYFPYHTGSFSVPTDQSTATALKQADLCWAATQSTPVAGVVPLSFEHQMAQLVVTTNTPTSKIACTVVPSGSLDPATGHFSLGSTKSEVFTTGNELILPAQPLNRLILTVSGVDYLFDNPIALEAGKTTTLNLTLNPSTKTATLNGSSVTAWVASSQSGNPTQTVSNVLTLHWTNYLPQGTTPDKIVLTINGTDYTVSSGITYANQTFTVPFASTALRYPYTITQITFFRGATQTAPVCLQLLGGLLYKSGAATIGIKDPTPNAVLINGLWWATGNLVASSSTAGAQGLGGCKIGSPTDGGLYFQFGSLIGYKGGAQTNGGTGVGMPQAPLTTSGTYWNGGSWGSFAADAMVWPSEMTKTPSAWPSNYGSSAGDRNTVVDQWFFNYNTAPYSTSGQDIRGFATSFTGDAGSGNLGTGRYAKWGIGDPCTYYLGGTWRLPTTNEIKAMCNNQGGYGQNIAWGSCGASWTGSPVNGGNFSSNKLFFPASGYRNHSLGSFYLVTTRGNYWSSSVNDATGGLHLYFYSTWVYPQLNYYRSIGFSVRCVSE